MADGQSSDSESPKLLRKPLYDELVDVDAFSGGGHQRIAGALANAIREFDGTDRAIGLDGKWGSGKSAVVSMARRVLDEEEGRKSTQYHFFTFDIWKAQAAPFRRSLLEHLVAWGKTTFPRRQSMIRELEAIEEDIQGKTQDIKTHSQPLLDWFGVVVLALLPFLPIYYFWVKSIIDNDKAIWTDWCLPISLIAVVLILTIWRVAVAYGALASDRDPLIRTRVLKAISQVLLIGARRFENQTVTQKIREVDPDDFEFQFLFRRILTTIQSKKDRVVVVLDNIDRLPEREISSTWALARSVFSSAPQNGAPQENETVTAIVPYDRELIRGAIGVGGDRTDTGEIFSKTFDEVLPIPSPVMSDTQTYFKAKLEEGLPKQIDNEHKQIAYLIFAEMQKGVAGSTTPRQILNFINELSLLYVLHKGGFTLATVAAFVAHRSELEQDPSVLRHTSTVDKRIKRLANDPDLEKNFAALLFNVDADLAFQILLDDVIAGAAVATKTDELKEISTAPGFDVRVADVVSNKVLDWLASGDLGVVIRNFAALSEDYEGDSISIVARSLERGLCSSADFKLTPETMPDYLRAYDLLEEESHKLVTANLVDCVGAVLENTDDIGAELGRNSLVCLGFLRGRLQNTELFDVFVASLECVKLPNNLPFLVAAAAISRESGIYLTDFADFDFVPNDNDLAGLLNLATEEPDRARGVFKEFADAQIYQEEIWATLSNDLISSFSDSEEHGPFADRLKLLADFYAYADATARSTIDLSALYSSAEFLEHMGTSNDDLFEAEILPAAVFLAEEHTTQTGQELPNSTNFDRLRSYLLDEVGLSKDQNNVVAGWVTRSSLVTAWLERGEKALARPIVDGVVKAVFSRSFLPGITAPTLANRYAYLRGVLGDEIVSVLSKYDNLSSRPAFTAMSLESVPKGLLADSLLTGMAAWQEFHNTISKKLDTFSPEEWRENITNESRALGVLNEKIASSGYLFQDQEVRHQIVDMVVECLAQEIDTPIGNMDRLLDAIDEDHHAVMFRSIRERLHSVTSDSLAEVAACFPRLLKGAIAQNTNAKRSEKNNLIRLVLVPALDGGIRLVLNAFVEIGRPRVRDFIRASEPDTKDSLQAAWKGFSENYGDADLKKELDRLINGRKSKKKKSGFFNPLGIGAVAREDEE